MPTPPRRTGKPSGRSGGAPDMMARATAQASRDASALFAHLDDLPLDVAQSDRERHAVTLERLAAHIRAGVWTDELAELVLLAQRAQETLDATSASE
jgi:hypothetical protein